MKIDIQAYNSLQKGGWRTICDLLALEIQNGLTNAQGKVWHGAPVWFINGNPIVGYFVRKSHVSLLFWSGQSFSEPGLLPEGKFKAAEARYTTAEQINSEDIQRWLKNPKIYSGIIRTYSGAKVCWNAWCKFIRLLLEGLIEKHNLT